VLEFASESTDISGRSSHVKAYDGSFVQRLCTLRIAYNTASRSG
jgi:hypothetical protein